MNYINFFMPIISGFFLLITLGYIFYERNNPAYSKELITQIDVALISFWLIWGTSHCIVIYENSLDRAFKKGNFLVLEGMAIKYIPPIFQKEKVF